MVNDSERLDTDPADDPELTALLAFDPVPRRIERSHGWSAQNQRAFIAGLVETGNYRMAAHALELTASGVYQLRRDVGSEDFARAWDEALALHKARQRSAQPSGRAGGGRAEAAARPGQDPARPLTIEEMRAEIAEHLRPLLDEYILKLKLEREARVAGRVVAADLYVRQLLAIEVALTRGGATRLVLEHYNKTAEGDAVVATPLTMGLDAVRRAYWAEADDLDRPPVPEIDRVTEQLDGLAHPAAATRARCRSGVTLR